MPAQWTVLSHTINVHDVIYVGIISLTLQYRRCCPQYRLMSLRSGYGKRHDLPVHSERWHSISAARPWTLFRRRRILLVLLALITLYLFFKNLPTDVPSVAQRIDSRTGRGQGRPPTEIQRPDAPRKPPTPPASQPHSQLYDGPVKFYHLSESLRPHLYTNDDVRPSVLFVVQRLQSMSPLADVACEMAQYNNTRVHMIVMVPEDLPLERLLDLNRLQSVDCPVFWHDARPDYHFLSSDARKELSVKAAIGHLHATLSPAVVLAEESFTETEMFVSALKERLDSLATPLTLIPSDAATSMSWIASLNPSALGLLNQVQISIMITPYKNSAGSLIRLLESLQRAHYSGLVIPQIVVELPANTDPSLLEYLTAFRWPSTSTGATGRLFLRKRLNESLLTPNLAALRTVESFYPASPNTHVLVLDADVELSPNFLQYLTYIALQYKYDSVDQHVNRRLMGLSLNLPDGDLVGDSTSIRRGNASKPFFLAQSPSIHATLFFGDKWVELQRWTTTRLRHDPRLEKQMNGDVKIPNMYSAYVRQVSELMQAQNYYFLYPGFADSPTTALVKIHREGSQHPEEYIRQLKQDREGGVSEILSLGKGSVLTAESESKRMHSAEPATQPIPILPMLFTDLNNSGRATLPRALNLPLFDARSGRTTWKESQVVAERYSDRVSLQLGGCRTVQDRDASRKGTIEFVFCEPG